MTAEVTHLGNNAGNMRRVSIATVTDIGPTGHNKIGIENSDGALQWYELTFGGVPPGVNQMNPLNWINNRLPAVVQVASERTNAFVVRDLEVSADSAERMIQFANELVEADNGKYHLLTNNCTSFCAATLRQGGIKVPFNVVRPVDLDNWAKKYARKD